MLNVNKVILAGNLTRDPALSETRSGMQICEFGIAVNRKTKDRDETCFLNVTVFGKQAEACKKYIAKGSNVYIEGRLVYESWEDKNGNKRNAVKVAADIVQFISSRNAETGTDADPGQHVENHSRSPHAGFDPGTAGKYAPKPGFTEARRNAGADLRSQYGPQINTPEEEELPPF